MRFLMKVMFCSNKQEVKIHDVIYDVIQSSATSLKKQTTIRQMFPFETDIFKANYNPNGGLIPGITL